QEIEPRHLVIPNQIIDRTRQRAVSFFGDGIVGHVSFADPFCGGLSDHLYQTIKSIDKVPVHQNETYLCMEGPLFSTRAESHLYRSWGCGIIGMTAIPEAKLAREAEICYACVAMSTDYDCWNEEEDEVTVEMVMENMNTNVSNVKSMLKDLISKIPDLSGCSCRTAAQNAILTDPAIIKDKKKQELGILYGKYI
ncbi:MAG: S-methyl-5'-thioadenosine phosphorylase, partial [Spirochaetota bacterium]|nr:S-methyl-5'-thioadenosine phosphorylase [Spirochaetota bacterium]